MDYNNYAKEFVARFSALANSRTPDFTVSRRGGETFLEIHVGKVTEIATKRLAEVKAELGEGNPFSNSVFLVERKVTNWLKSLEVDALQNLMSESLTIGRDSLKSEFYKKFIPFVGGEEKRIASKTNTIVFGRRGAGKSSLIVYGCNKVVEAGQPYVWVAMQQYHNRTDLQVIPQVLFEIVSQLEEELGPDASARLKELVYTLESEGTKLNYETIRIKLPLISRYLLPLVRRKGALYVFIDDLHLIGRKLQPKFLSTLYSFCRGNSIYLKISAIENLTTLFDYDTKEGMEIPGDLQKVALDYNLMSPGQAHTHISDIIESYVQYVGIPSLGSLCVPDARHRLTWVSAGVPRDALYVFNNSITKARSNERKKVAVTDINMSAADSMTEKEKYVSDDVEDRPEDLLQVIGEVKDFCFDVAKSNAFLVHNAPAHPRYQLVQKLIDLRFLHILHPGITPDRKNEKYEALLLDYAFYTGFRKTRSIKEFKVKPEAPSSKELRSLSRFRLSS